MMLVHAVPAPAPAFAGRHAYLPSLPTQQVVPGLQSEGLDAQDVLVEPELLLLLLQPHAASDSAPDSTSPVMVESGERREESL